MPDQLAQRDDVTFAQKQRLAMMAKMGVGPISNPSSRGSSQAALLGGEDGREPPRVDKRAEMLAKERRFREQQERQDEVEEEQFVWSTNKKRPPPKAASGLVSLGPVMPRRDCIPKVLPTPAPAPPPLPEPRPFLGVAQAPKSELKLELKISKETAHRARKASSGDAGCEAELEDDDDKELSRPERRRGAAPQQHDPAQQGGRNKSRKKGRGEEEYEDWNDEENWDEEPLPEAWPQHDRKPLRDATPKPQMVVESVKGKVSTANKNYTDADLQRRFQMFGGDDSHGASLMTEEQVLRMIRKEKQERGIGGSSGANSGAAARRVQRELDEWEKAKEQQRARVKSPRRFERMVVARK